MVRRRAGRLAGRAAIGAPRPRERIYTAAAGHDLPATGYERVQHRRAGGQGALLTGHRLPPRRAGIRRSAKTATARTAARIIEKVRRSVEGQARAERVLTAVSVAVAEIRSDPAGQLFIDSVRGARGTTWLTASPAIAAFADELAGLEDDPAAAQWIVRLVLSPALLARRRRPGRTRTAATVRRARVSPVVTPSVEDPPCDVGAHQVEEFVTAAGQDGPNRVQREALACSAVIAGGMESS